MAVIRSLLCDERSGITTRHAAIVSVAAVAGVAVGILLTIVGNQLYEQTTHRILWALAGCTGVAGA